MNQSAIIGGALLAGFAMFLASQDRLSAYARVLFGDKPGTHGAGGEPKATGDSDETNLFGLPDLDFGLPTLDDLEGYIDREVWGVG